MVTVEDVASRNLKHEARYHTTTKSFPNSHLRCRRAGLSDLRTRQGFDGRQQRSHNKTRDSWDRSRDWGRDIHAHILVWELNKSVDRYLFEPERRIELLTYSLRGISPSTAVLTRTIVATTPGRATAVLIAISCTQPLK